MHGLDARVLTISPGRPGRAAVITFGALVRSGFRRYATYRQATVAGAFTTWWSASCAATSCWRWPVAGPADTTRRSSPRTAGWVKGLVEPDIEEVVARPYTCSMTSTAQVPGASAS